MTQLSLLSHLVDPQSSDQLNQNINYIFLAFEQVVNFKIIKNNSIHNHFFYGLYHIIAYYYNFENFLY